MIEPPQKRPKFEKEDHLMLEPPQKRAKYTNEEHFGPDNTVKAQSPDLYKNNDPANIIARRHDMDVTSALAIKNREKRLQALNKADTKFMKKMNTIKFKQPLKWVQSRIFATGVQKIHYGQKNLRS